MGVASRDKLAYRLRRIKVQPSLRRPRDLLAGILRPFPRSHRLEGEFA